MSMPNTTPHVALRADYAVMETDADQTFRILQITDFHTDVDEALNDQTWRDVRSMIDHVKPGLLAVTGDIWCGDDAPDQAPDWMRRDLAIIGSLGVPWAFCLGNHDYTDDLEEFLAAIAATPNAVAPRGDGQGNFRIEIVSADNKPVWDLYFLNSRTECLLPQDTDWLEHEARRLQRERGEIVPAIAFFHIPLKAYETARIEGRYQGIALEEVLYWGDDGTLLDRIARAGSVRACFVGHSHVNDFHFEEKGIVLAYGRVTGYGGYGGEKVKRGGKALILNAHGGFTFETIFADGSTWLTVTEPGPA